MAGVGVRIKEEENRGREKGRKGAKRSEGRKGRGRRAPTEVLQKLAPMIA